MNEVSWLLQSVPYEIKKVIRLRAHSCNRRGIIAK
uniref:Uncharacterized protein n=1 Tax=Utricularia reniformis TaxID=192314 RepID=A0A1Y0B2N8_9LAMI|nr:hypothetical protein AEK19_MT1516 [Utricularia reniformis]ART31706.1 hypothetical protein AEK19_MT1516 [Utricularia reniformis]